MIYVIVGPDGSGKTTCVKRLQEYCTFTGDSKLFVKESYTDDSDDKWHRVERMYKLFRSGIDVVYDRATVIDDLVYNGITPGEAVSNIRRREYAVALMHTEARVIYMYADVDTLSARVDRRGDEYIRTSQLQAILDGYEATFEELGVEPYRIDTSVMSEDEALEAVHDIVCHKSFKLAHIVPVGSLSKLDGKQYLMCLAHLVKQSDEYAGYYTNAASDRGRFVLMDNGAAEGSQLSNEELLECYLKVRPDELVLPDTLCDTDDTLAKFGPALDYFTAHNLPCRFMAVPQGETLDDWVRCAEVMVQDPRVDTIGVSKFLTQVTGNLTARMVALGELGCLIEKYRRYDLEVHLLGCNEEPALVHMMAKAFPFVRGCDTACGYLCAKAGIEVHATTDRPNRTIDFLGGKDYDSLSATLLDFEIACGVYNNAHDVTWRKGE